MTSVQKYESQVKGKHKQWPRAIKERVIELYRSGLTLKVISAQSGISYHTLSSWTSKVSGPKFKEIAVKSSSKKLLLPSMRRPVGRPRTIHKKHRNGTVTMKISDGTIVEGLTVLDLVEFFKGIRARSCS